MPIGFTISGIVFLLLITDVINIKNKFFKVLILLFSFVLTISYFVGTISFFEIYFNVLQCIVFFILLFFIIFNSKKFFSLLLFALLTSLIYYFVLKNNNEFLISYNSSLFIILSMSSSIFFLKFYKEFIGSIILNLACLIFINIKFEIDEFTFAIVNFDLLFDLIIIFSLIYFNLNIAKCLFFKKETNYIYDQKNIYIFNSNSFVHTNI